MAHLATKTDLDEDCYHRNHEIDSIAYTVVKDDNPLIG